jgi:hypothetical protein
MRTIAAIGAVLWGLGFAGGSMAQQADHDVQTGMVNDGVTGEACFGDRYESDADMNDGNTITEEEILRLLNPPGS